MFSILPCCTVQDTECPLISHGLDSCSVLSLVAKIWCVALVVDLFSSCTFFLPVSILFLWSFLFLPAVHEHKGICFFSSSTIFFSWTACLFKSYNPSQGQSYPLAALYIDASTLGLSFYLLMFFRLSWAFSWYLGEQKSKPQTICLALHAWHMSCCFRSPGYLVSH